MESFLIKALQLIVSLALLVVLHEFGHYLFARIFGIKVEKYYLFFNPWWTPLKWKPRPPKHRKTDKDGNPKASWRDTEYGIGWLPLGGYCKIAGMIDESMDKEQMALPPKPDEFRSKPAYQRLLVMAGGVLFNFITAIIIYAGMAFYWGDKYVPLDKVSEGFDYAPAAGAIGFRNGDRPLAVDGKTLDPKDPMFALKMVEGRQVQVLRDKRDTVTVAIPENFIFRVNNDQGFLSMRIPTVVDKLVNGEAAQKAGLEVGDRIIKVDTIATPSYTELTPALQNFKGKATTVTVIRNGKMLTLAVTPNDYGKLGFQLRQPVDVYPTVTEHYNLLQALPKGWEMGSGMLTTYVGSMKHVVSKEGAESIGGFGSIGNMFPDRWNWYTFWQITAFLSVALAFMNIIPIPGLDGGHIMFLLWEIVTRRKPSDKFMEVAQYIGMAFLILLLVYANGNDIVRAFR